MKKIKVVIAILLIGIMSFICGYIYSIMEKQNTTSTVGQISCEQNIISF